MTVIKFVDFEPKHLTNINLQSAQQHIIDSYTSEQMEACCRTLQQHPTLTIVAGEVVLAIISMVQVSENRGLVSTFISVEAAPRMYAVTKMTKLALSRFKYLRIEAITETNFIPGNRWLKLLGFQLEGTMRKYDHFGNDYNLYSLISGD